MFLINTMALRAGRLSAMALNNCENFGEAWFHGTKTREAQSCGTRVCIIVADSSAMALRATAVTLTRHLVFLF